ncbi:unnamed protein product [Arabis nemorensis]|uniref:Uncharacterized protein n=1 Tax=Arabis nemorensis TaxID=586526 RepID=A0A565B146_9BRAS|nr:unnamed protein product [Arabis nemorensis]
MVNPEEETERFEQGSCRKLSSGRRSRRAVLQNYASCVPRRRRRSDDASRGEESLVGGVSAETSHRVFKVPRRLLENRI